MIKKAGRPRKQERESTVEEYLVKRVKQLGGEIRKVKWVARDAAPDRLVMLPSLPTEVDGIAFEASPFSFYVELKAEGLAAKFPHNEHERAQKREHDRMRAFGLRVEVIDSKQQIDELIARPYQ